MLELTDMKAPRRIAATAARSTTIARPRTAAPATEIRPNAAPLTLAAVVACGLLLAVTAAIVTALGG